MELWIRSQDRLRLARMDSVIINARNKKEITSNYSYTSDGFEKDIPLGEYKTEERALEVLDEIQNILMPKITYTPIVEEDIKPQYTYRHFISEKGETNILELSTYVYDMPQE